MKQGVAQVVVVRIADRSSRTAFRDLPSDFAVERLRTSATMKAQLIGDADIFAIRSLSSDQQALVGDVTDWKWVVTPQIPGNHQLYLTVTAVLRLSTGAIESRDVLVKQATISVAVNRRWQVTSFIRSNWQWLLGSPLILGGLGWLMNRLRKRRSNRAGF